MVDNILLWFVLLNAVFTLYWVTILTAHSIGAAIFYKLIPTTFALGALMYALNEFGII